MPSKSECPRQNRICPFSLGIAFGVTKALFMLFSAWAGYFWGYGTVLIKQIAVLYHGFAPTIIGGLYGALWGFVGGFVFGFIAGLIYDFCLCCCCVKTSLCEHKNKKDP